MTQEHRSPGQANPALRPRRVLIVDDNTDCSYVLAAYLTLQGHRVRTAVDAAEALQIAADSRPEVIFLDICMPATNGHELCARLRQMQALSGAVIYALTALDAHDLVRQGLSGFDGHYTKPVDFARLAAALIERSPPAT